MYKSPNFTALVWKHKGRCEACEEEVAVSLTEDLGLHWDGMEEEREHTPLSKPGAMLWATNKATLKRGSPSGFGVFLVYWLHHWLSRYTDPEATSKSVDTKKSNQE